MSDCDQSSRSDQANRECLFSLKHSYRFKDYSGPAVDFQFSIPGSWKRKLLQKIFYLLLFILNLAGFPGGSEG